LKRPKIYLGALVTLGLVVSVTMGALVMAAEPPGANADNVQMEVRGLPTSQRASENVVYTMNVTNEQSTPPSYTAYARNITVTFYPAQADGNPSPTGTVVGNISLLVVDAEPVIIVVTYPMPALNPGVTAAISRVVLNGTSMRDPSLPCYIEKELSIALLSEPPVAPVGGAAFPVNKVGLVAPWAVLLGCGGVVTLLMLRKRRQA
jgi:hypothetical protein